MITDHPMTHCTRAPRDPKTLAREEWLLHGEERRRGRAGHHTHRHAMATAQVRVLHTRATCSNNMVTASTVALFNAVRHGRVALVAALLRHKVDVNIRDATGATPIRIAVDRDDLRMTQLLLKWGANPKLSDHTGGDIVHMAQHARSVSMRALLTTGRLPSWGIRLGSFVYRAANRLRLRGRALALALSPPMAPVPSLGYRRKSAS